MKCLFIFYNAHKIFPEEPMGVNPPPWLPHWNTSSYQMGCLLVLQFHLKVYFKVHFKRQYYIAATTEVLLSSAHPPEISCQRTRYVNSSVSLYLDSAHA